MGGMRHGLQDFRQGGRPADPLEITLGPEPFKHDRGIDSLAGIVQVEQVPKEHLMCLVVEVFRPENERHVVADVGLQQNAAQHGPLGVDVGGAFCPEDAGGKAAGRITGAGVAAPWSATISIAVETAARSSLFRRRHRSASLRDGSRQAQSPGNTAEAVNTDYLEVESPLDGTTHTLRSPSASAASLTRTV